MMKKSAFTLIELLIVITIIGVLTSILVLNFQGVKEKQEMALLAGKSLALMQQTKADVRSGKVEIDEAGETSYVCEGALFAVGEHPEFVKAPYLADSGVCDFAALSFENYGLDSGGAYVGSIELVVDGQEPDTLLALFVPPSGALELYSEDGSSSYDGSAELRFASASYEVDETQTAAVLQLSEDSGFAQLVFVDPTADEE